MAFAVLERKVGFHDRQEVQRIEPASSMSRPAKQSCVIVN